MRRIGPMVGVAFVVGVVLGAALSGRSSGVTMPQASAAPTTPDDDEVTEQEFHQLQARMAMVMVDYHASNLWFAGKAENWPLAEFYWNETLNHVRLSVRFRPVREGRAGDQIKIAKIAKAIEAAPGTQVGEAIRDKDLERFLFSYRSLLEGCYACHKAADAPYLRPRMPVPPAASIITVDKNAPWPK